MRCFFETQLVCFMTIGIYIKDALLYIFVLIIGFSIPNDMLAQTQKADAVSEVLNLHRKKFDWMVRAQVDSLGSILDRDIAYVHSNGWTESREDIIRNLSTGHLKHNKVNVIEESARKYGNVIIVNGKGQFDVALDDKPINIWLIYTEVYYNDQGQWLLVSRHANRAE